MYTEKAYFASLADIESYRRLGVEQFEFLATLDSRTSEICQEMDGRVFKVSQYEIGVNVPPLHPNCRSTTVPYFEDDEFDSGERAARGADGKTHYVPANMKYAEWKAKFVDCPKQEAYNAFKNETHELIRSTFFPPKLNSLLQNRHIEGTTEFDPTRGTLTVDPEVLFTKYAGKGDPIRASSGKWANKERFEHTAEIGIWRDKFTGVEAPTKTGIIHYSKRQGAHIVPANPKQRGQKP